MLNHYLSKLCNDISNNKLTPHKIKKYVQNNNIILKALEKNNNANVQIGGADPLSDDAKALFMAYYTKLKTDISKLFSAYDETQDIYVFVQKLWHEFSPEYVYIQSGWFKHVCLISLMIRFVDQFTIPPDIDEMKQIRDYIEKIRFAVSGEDPREIMRDMRNEDIRTEANKDLNSLIDGNPYYVLMADYVMFHDPSKTQNDSAYGLMREIIDLLDGIPKKL